MNKFSFPLSSLLKKIEPLTRRLPIDQIKQWTDHLLPASSSSRDLLVLRPGTAKGEWQLWKIPLQKSTQGKKELIPPLLLEEQASPPTLSPKINLVVGVPTRDLIVYPLWVASESNFQELVTLELSSKNLLRRSMAEGLKIIPLSQKEGRTLVVALISTTIPSDSNAPYLEQATNFEAAARLLGAQGADLFLWRELGEICFGFLREDQFVWFSGSGETEVNTQLLGLIKRMSFQFQAEAILEKMPQKIHLLGSFSEEAQRLLRGSFQEVSEGPEKNSPPVFPTPLLDLPSPQARHARLLEEKRKQIKKIAALALLAYLFFLFLGGTNLLVKECILHHLTQQLAAKQPAIEKATQTILTWHEFRGAFDPRVYVLDQLALIASKMKGEKIRLITLAGADGKLHIAGEASDVSQAYHFMESIKAAPELQEYQWLSDQPKLAGKNNVRFELEGSLPNAKTSPE